MENTITMPSINTEKVETLPTASPINYMKEYFNYCKLKKEDKEKGENTLAFFKEIEDEVSFDENIKTTRKYIKTLEEKVIDMKSNLNDMYALKYAEHIEPFPKRVIVHYASQRSDTSEYYDIVSGCITDDISDAFIVTMGTKNEYLYIPVGYVYKRGAIVVREYDAKVAPNNKSVSLKNCGESLIDIFNLDVEDSNGNKYDAPYRIRKDILEKIFATDFILKMFGRDISEMAEYSKTFSLEDISTFYRKNANFETIIKCAPINALRELAEIETEETKPIYQMLGITKESYNKAVELHIVDKLPELTEYRTNPKKRNIINLTDEEWIDLIVQSLEWERDLAFYRISYDRAYYSRSLLHTLVYNYTYNENFNQNYTFRKFCQYVVNATIDQGYSDVLDFIQHLRDYIDMALKNNSKPIWETTYLKVSHDIAKRNFDIKVSEEQEELFKSLYEDFKPFTKDEYTLIAPKSTDDIKYEGNTLNHCVASYIHRILKGETRIFFLRKAKEPDVPLCTVEIRDGRICQYSGSHNRNLHKDELAFLKLFAEKRELKI